MDNTEGTPAVEASSAGAPDVPPAPSVETHEPPSSVDPESTLSGDEKAFKATNSSESDSGSGSEECAPKITFNERVHLFEEALKPSVIDLSIIRNLAVQGIPEAPGLRPIYWKILLNYLPINKPNWARDLTSMRKTYTEWMTELFVDPHEGEEEKHDDHPLSTSTSSKWNAFFKDTEIMEEIEKDVKRTFPHLHFFNHDKQTGSTGHYEALRRILFIYAKLNPGIRYVQGMNEILGPIYYCFATDPICNAYGADEGLSPTDVSKLFDWKENAEADAFFCFTNLMSEIMNNFLKTLDRSEVGVSGSIQRLNQLLREQDEELWMNLEEKKLNPQFYSFRWITLLLSQEFELPDVMRLWDSLFADQWRFRFLYYFCCAMLICVRDRLLAGTFADNLKLLQSYPPIDFQIIHRTAHDLRDGVWEPPAPRPGTGPAAAKRKPKSRTSSPSIISSSLSQLSVATHNITANLKEKSREKFFSSGAMLPTSSATVAVPVSGSDTPPSSSSSSSPRISPGTFFNAKEEKSSGFTISLPKGWGKFTL
eukprot:TRINITY_DN18189_c0_g1_i1.p1 TRINITY_DN18189_c0_g1~~TRINITY_DN18189_c0_g1_i1.p1  ORF type:complete len:537 (+),score=143.62 TRINITY_DN18189_c0_g1_i1:1-1611(+)